MMNPPLSQQEQAFTLIEVLIVITIISILILALLPGYSLFVAKSRLSVMTETIAETITEAKNRVVTGNMSDGETEEISAVGVYMERGGHRIALFSCPLSVVSNGEPLYVPGREIKWIDTGNIYIRNILTQEDREHVVILFIPPHGEARIVRNDVLSVGEKEVTIEVGVGLTDQVLRKYIMFNATTAVVQYD